MAAHAHEPATCHGEEDARPDDAARARCHGAPNPKSACMQASVSRIAVTVSRHSHLVLALGDGVPASSGDADGDDENEKDAALRTRRSA